MIVRTAPVLPPQQDVMRILERLEAQLRRAADDIAAVTADVRSLAEEEAARVVAFPMPDGTRCNKWMPRVGEGCGRFTGHKDSCRSRQAMDDEKAMRARKRS